MRRSDAEGSAVLEEEPLAFPEVVPAEGFDEDLAEVVPAEGFDEGLAEAVPVNAIKVASGANFLAVSPTLR